MYGVMVLQAPKGATQSAGVVVEQSAGCMYVKVSGPAAFYSPHALVLFLLSCLNLTLGACHGI